MLKKMFLIVAALMMMTAPVFAGNTPEFDIVGDDSAYFFKDKVDQLVIDNNIRGGVKINTKSDFTNPAALDDVKAAEFFVTDAGLLFPDDPCFPGYTSAMVDATNPAFFTWQIVLQLKPETDLDILIRDCVLKHNQMKPMGPGLFGAAEQTGRWRKSNGQLKFKEAFNPSITVTAFNGPLNKSLPAAGLILDGRTMPGLDVVALDEALFTSKGPWEEVIIVALPDVGARTSEGYVAPFLKQGDKIQVTITAPVNHPEDMWFGKDNVAVKYVGIVGTDFFKK